MTNLKLVEASLNLRVEKRKNHTNMDYTLTQDVAMKQLALNADVYANVEYMLCQDQEYRKAFEDAGYQQYCCLDESHPRGNMCMIKKDIEVKYIAQFNDPHFLHLQLMKDNTTINLIVVRILVSSSDEADYQDRKKQFDFIKEYIDCMEDTKHTILTGDFNHGVISETYKDDEARRLYNYQMIVSDLKESGMELIPLDGMSYQGYMKIDHIFVGSNIYCSDAEYYDSFGDCKKIGIPDHNMIVTSIECK